MAWQSPIGALKFSYAIPLANKPATRRSGSSSRWHAVPGVEGDAEKSMLKRWLGLCVDGGSGLSTSGTAAASRVRPSDIKIGVVNTENC